MGKQMKLPSQGISQSQAAALLQSPACSVPADGTDVSSRVFFTFSDADDQYTEWT